MKKFLLFISSWAVVLLFGILLAVLLLAWSAGLQMELTPETGGFTLTVFGLAGLLVLTLVMKLLKRLKQIRFNKYAQTGIIVGMCIFAFAGLSGMVITSAPSIAVIGQRNICFSSANEQIYNAKNSTVPIGTDSGSGTGFVVSSDGLIVTADHVIDGASKVFLNIQNDTQPLEIVDRAPEYDLALLKSNRTYGYFTPLTSKYNQADEVIAVGYPGSAFTAGEASVTKGIVSRDVTNSDIKSITPNVPSNLALIQTDAAVNPGNSGGPLVNKCGVVGLVSAKSDKNSLQQYGISSEEGISYAVSASSIAARFSLPIEK